MLAYEAASAEAHAPREISAGIRRLALFYLWITIATGAVVFSEPAPYDLLMVGAIVILPLTGLAPLTRGMAPYLLLLTGIVAGGFIATTQAGLIDVPAKHVGITLYLAVSSVVMAAFFADRPERRIRFVMGAYMTAAVVAAAAALIGYFALVPG